MATIDILLERWHSLKEEIRELTDQEQFIRDKVKKVMEKNDEFVLQSTEFIVKRRIQTRESVSKKDVPREVWDKYKKESDFTIMSVSKKRD